MTFHFLAGCEFIKPVSGFECHLCRVFIRNGSDIEDHISLLQHKTFYQVRTDFTGCQILPVMSALHWVTYFDDAMNNAVP